MTEAQLARIEAAYRQAVAERKPLVKAFSERELNAEERLELLRLSAIVAFVEDAIKETK